MVHDFEILKGKTIQKIIRNEDSSLIFEISEDEKYIMHHVQDCCESVYIDDICGDLDWLINVPILKAEERVTHNPAKDDSIEELPDTYFYEEADDTSCTWTFYELATINGSVTIRWYGESNGYYSENVVLKDFKERNSNV